MDEASEIRDLKNKLWLEQKKADDLREKLAAKVDEVNALKLNPPAGLEVRVREWVETCIGLEAMRPKERWDQPGWTDNRPLPGPEPDLPGMLQGGDAAREDAVMAKKCCEYDYNEDGNCHVHSSPGVFRDAANDPNSLTLDKLLKLADEVNKIPQYEIQLCHASFTPFQIAWDRLTIPHGPAPSNSLHPAGIGLLYHMGIPIQAVDYMPPGVGALVKKRPDGGSDLLFLLYFQTGEIKAVKMDGLEAGTPFVWPTIEFKLKPI